MTRAILVSAACAKADARIVRIRRVKRIKPIDLKIKGKKTAEAFAAGESPALGGIISPPPCRENPTMNGRNLNARSLRYSVVAPLALALSLTFASAGSQAGILRDVMVSVGLSKPAPPPPGSQTLPRQGFACCALHYKRDWINDGNYAE